MYTFTFVSGETDLLKKEYYKVVQIWPELICV